MSTELDLIKLAQQGNKSAFARLYDQHYQAVYTYIYYRVGHRPLAEDLTGDVFERMVTKIDSWRPAGKPFVAWLYTIAGNVVRNHIKREKRIEWLPLNDNDPGTGESVMALIGEKIRGEQLKEALNMLTEDQRQVIILRFLKGESIAAVAHVVGKPETSIKALQRRAIQALARVLNKEEAYG